MKLSKFFIPAKKEIPSDVKLNSHILMLRSGMIHLEVSGIYSWLPFGFRVLKKIQNIIEEEHIRNDINQMLMPTIQPSEIWIKSNRFDSYGLEMLKITDRNKKKLLYGPTNEEMVTVIGNDYINSYKQLPVNLFHIQTKFRDEIRPRHGVMRAREFIMKDAYSFDKNKNDSYDTYKMYFKIYIQIFKKLGIDIIPVKALSGEIGGEISHEFHMICESGESRIIYTDLPNEKSVFDYFDFYKKNYSSTDEYFNKDEKKPKTYHVANSIELGHIFLFGEKYSKPFNFKIDTPEGSVNPYMGSYGIGISRLPAAIIEKNYDKKGIIWPKEISPFDLMLINLKIENEGCLSFCEGLYKELKKYNIEVLYDDTNERVGIKFNKSDLFGVPYQIIVGNKYTENKMVQIKNRKTHLEVECSAGQILKKILSIIKDD